MKKFILPLFIALLGTACITLSTSCQKDYNSSPDNSNTTRNPLQGTFSCYIGGIYYEADAKYYWDSTSTIFISAKQFSANNSTQVYKVFNLNIKYSDQGPGEYKVSDGKVTGGYSNVDSFTQYNYTIVNVDTMDRARVTSNSGNITGTFSVTIRPVGVSGNSQDIKVTNGEFNIPKN